MCCEALLVGGVCRRNFHGWCDDWTREENYGDGYLERVEYSGLLVRSDVGDCYRDGACCWRDIDFGMIPAMESMSIHWEHDLLPILGL